METGEYETNTLLINNVSSIAYRTYHISSDRSHPTTAPTPTVAQDVEESFRSVGCIAHFDMNRRILWQFEITSKDGTLCAKPGGPGLPEGFEIPDVTLSPEDNGAFEPMSLQRTRIPTPHGNNTPTSAMSSSSGFDYQRSAGAFSASTNASGGWSAVEPEMKTIRFGVSEPKGPELGAITINEAYENFVFAVLGAILLNFGKKTGGIPLDNRTLLLPPSHSTDEGPDKAIPKPPVIASFRIYLTTTGSLLLSLSLRPGDGLASLETPPNPGTAPAETQIITAPFGVAARYQGPVDINSSGIDGMPAQTPDTQVWRLNESKSSPWRQTLTKLLQLRGIVPPLLNCSPWINIQIIRQRIGEHRLDGKPPPIFNATTTISWPASLCFRRQPSSSPPTSRLGGNLLVGYEESYDPLASAKAWFQEAPERAEKSAKRRKESELAETREATETNARPQQQHQQQQQQQQQQPEGNSPLALHRVGNPTAAGSMYPTPPDGVQNPHGVTPSLEGTVSSPPNQAPTVAVVDMDAVMGNTTTAGDSYAEAWDSGEVKRERTETGYLGDSDNLFDDDMGNDMFNDSELTDADFNFFDEQLGDASLDMGDLGDMGAPEPSSHAAQHSSVPPTRPKSTSVSRSASVKPEPDAPIFAKPELKHARSILMDEGKSSLSNGTAAGIKREPSPFDPHTVFKRVRASLSQPSDQQPKQATRRGSIYEKDDGLVLPPVNSKYVDGGKYAYNWASTRENAKIKVTMPPTTDYLRRHGKHGKGAMKGLPENHGALIAKITSGLGSSSIQASPVKGDELPSDADDVSLVSDQDDVSISSDEPASPVKSSLKRANVEDDSTSQATSFRDVELPDESDPSFALELPKLSKADVPDLSIARFFADPEPLPLQLSLPDEDMITIAQILTEQAASGSLVIPSDGSWGKPPVSMPDSRRQIAALSRQAVRALRDAVPECLGEPAECNFRQYVEMQDVPLLGAPNRSLLQPRPVPGRDPNELMKPPNIYQINSPHFQLKRSESNLSVLPSAVTFWESLGLGPSHGPKDIRAVCIFPGWDGMVDNINMFLDRMRNTYESLKLGSFERLPSSENIADGLVRYEVEKISVTPGNVFPRISTALAERTDLLCHALTTCTESDKNVVVFYLYSPWNPSSIVEACTAFNQLFEVYKSSLSERKKPPNNELVLQLIPLDFVGASTSVVISSPADVTKLCLETYDRCTMFNGPMPAPAIVLEQMPPRMFDFKLASTPSASLMHENSCIHVAYSRSVDGRWVTAAWTDYRGTQQMTASYCLGRKGRNQVTSFNEVAHEIWETTHDIISIWKVHWRIVITKCGVMEPSESEFWTDLAQTESKATVSLVLMTVDTTPSLQLIPPAVKLSPALGMAFYSTPVSTPQPSILSPDQSGNNPSTPSKEAGTPGGDGADPASAEGLLTDVADQTWGCVLAHRLSNSNSLAELAPALFSGYLVKRGGTSVEDPPAVIEVNLLYSDGNPRGYETLLREMLGHFRALGSLSRARGVTAGADVRPWHVAAAEKGARALYLLM